jgi:hypothetical protein
MQFIIVMISKFNVDQSLRNYTNCLARRITRSPRDRTHHRNVAATSD